MIQNMLVYLLFFIIASNHANSFNIEGILGGYYPLEGTFKYQISLNIMRTPTGSENTMLCTGAIIHKQFVLTIATCVIHKTVVQRSGLFLMRWYRIISGTHYLNLESSLFVDVEEIFVPEKYDPYTHEADLAVIKLANEYNFDEYPQLKSLDLPANNTIDDDVIAVASGYGYITFLENEGFTYYELKYVRVNVTSIDECRSLTHLESDNLLCAKSIPDRPEDFWGICKGDAGAPLVYNDKLIGLANRARHNCVDTQRPTEYTRIKPYTEFIRSILDGTPPPGTRTFTDPFAAEEAFLIPQSIIYR